MSDLAASGGYYIAMPAQVDRRAAGDADRLDRHLRRQDRDRRRLRKARRAHRVDEHRQATPRSNSPARPFNAEELQEGAGAAAGVLRSVRREGRRVAAHDAGEDRRARAGARVDRAAGEGERPGRRARRPRPRDRHRQAAREDSPPTARSSWSSIRRARASTSCSPSSSAGRASQAAVGALAVGEPVARASSRRCARCAGRCALFRRGEPLALMPFTFLR